MTNSLAERIRGELQVPRDFDAAREAEWRIAFLAGYLQESGLGGYVLGISGGIDSTVAGRLAQLACERVRGQGGAATFVALRLPYGIQHDAADADHAVAFIAPDEAATINVGGATDAMWEEVLAARGDAGPLPGGTPGRYNEFVRGNIKARQRMIAQYAVAGARGLAVVGTDQAAEALVGFFTKFGDGASDVVPLAGLPKRRVRELARHLGVPEHLVVKVPTADLESDNPMEPDEVALGVSYEQVDDFLEGLPVPPEAEEVILNWYRRSQHKRQLPLTPQTWHDAHHT